MISLKILTHLITCRLGAKVAMFRYSSVEIYSACKPPMALQFHDPNRKEWLDVEVNNVCVYKCFSAALHFPLAPSFLHLNILLFLKVLLKWKLLLSEIDNIIQGLKSRYSGEAMGDNRNSSANDGLFLEVSGLLAQEKDEFEVSLFFFH
jgi:1-phosphatidylinositol-3-phosphate 5-kinase